MYQTKYFIIVVLCGVFFLGCQEKKIEDKALKAITTKYKGDCPNYIFKNKENNLNISILLDLSDRIKNKKTIQKDSAYLSSIANALINHIKNKKQETNFIRR